MIGLLGVALAGPLPPCTEDDPVQQTLLGGVHDLQFEGDRLWVADAGSLTARDVNTLEVVERPVPGVNAWRRIDAEPFEAASAAGVWWRPGAFGFRGERFDRWPDRNGLRLHEGALWQGDVRLWALPPELLRGRQVLHRSDASPHLDLWAEDDGSGGKERIAALARDPGTGRVAVATDDRLTMFDAAGQVLAQTPIVPTASGAGLLEGQLYTLSGGYLDLWSADGMERRTLFEGGFDALPGPGGLWVSDLGGRLLRVHPRSGKAELLGCLVASCDLDAVDMPLRPAPSGTLDLDGAALLAWGRELAAWRDRQRPLPTALFPADDGLVVAVLDPLTWDTRRVPVATALVRVQPDGSVGPSRELPEPRALSALTFAGGQVWGTGLRWDLTDLADTTADVADGTPVLDIQNLEDGDRVRVGHWVGGALAPAPRLPPRMATQERQATRGRIQGDRFVLWPSAAGVDGSVEVWCLPDAGGEPRTYAPGEITAPRRGRPIAPGPGAAATSLVEPRRSDLPDGLVWRGPDPDLRLLKRAARAVPVTVMSEGRPERLPSGVGWVEAPPSAPELVFSVGGLEVWRGDPERFDPILFRTGAPAAADEDARRAWTARFDGPDRKLAERVEAFDAASEAGDDARVRELARAILELSPRHVAANLVWVVGQPFPRLLWEPSPPASASFVVLLDGTDAQVFALSERAGLPGHRVVRRGTPGVSRTHSTAQAALFPALPGGTALWIVDGEVRWAGPATDMPALGGTE